MVYSLLIVDIIFINSLIQEKSRMIDVIHVFFIVYILLLFSDNKYIISIFISLKIIDYVLLLDLLQQMSNGKLQKH